MAPNSAQLRAIGGGLQADELVDDDVTGRQRGVETEAAEGHELGRLLGRAHVALATRGLLLRRLGGIQVGVALLVDCRVLTTHPPLQHAQLRGAHGDEQHLTIGVVGRRTVDGQARLDCLRVGRDDGVLDTFRWSLLGARTAFITQFGSRACWRRASSAATEATPTAAIAARPTTARGTAQPRCRRLNDRTSTSGSITINCCVSTRELTIATAWIAVLAIVALVAAGWRKPARATANPARALLPKRARVGLPVTEVDVPLHRPTPLWQKIWALVAGSTMALVTGAVAATVIGFGASWMVVTLSRLLKR